MCKREFRAATVPQYKIVVGAFMERETQGKHDVTVTACRKAKRIVVEGAGLSEVYHACLDIGYDVKSFVREWKAVTERVKM